MQIEYTEKRYIITPESQEESNCLSELFRLLLSLFASFSQRHRDAETKAFALQFDKVYQSIYQPDRRETTQEYVVMP